LDGEAICRKGIDRVLMSEKIIQILSGL